MTTIPSPQDILARIREDGIKFINLQFTDILGVIKSTPIPVARLAEAMDKGLWFDGSSVEGFGRIYESDMVLYPDLSTYAILPWSSPERRVARIICDVHDPDGKPFAGDPRFILKQAMAQSEKLG